MREDKKTRSLVHRCLRRERVVSWGLGPRGTGKHPVRTKRQIHGSRTWKRNVGGENEYQQSRTNDIQGTGSLRLVYLHGGEPTHWNSFTEMDRLGGKRCRHSTLL